MRVLRVAQNLYPEVPGGGTYHVHALSRDQAARGHDVTVLTVSNDESLPRRERRDGYTVVRCRPVASVLGNEMSVAMARALRRAENYDVVHAHSHLYFSTNLASVRRRFGSVPLAITNHGLYSQTAPRWLFDVYLRSLGRWTFNRADTVFCYTDIDERRLREYGVTAPIAVVPNGIDTTRFSPDGLDSDRLTTGDPTVLFVGRLVEGKRPADAVRALAALRERRPDAQLYVCGDGQLRSQLTQQVTDAGLSEAVTFLGHVPYDEMPALYRSADALVLTSESEGLPRTVLEAMASETPVVTSSLPQLVDIVDGAGKTVQTGSIGEFAEALEAVTTKSGYGETGRNRVVAEYDWASTVADVTDRLESL
jgi:glycosyltransferase involved in cell wall biosynthesis